MSCEAVIAIIYSMKTIYSVILRITTQVCDKLTTESKFILFYYNKAKSGLIRKLGDM